MKHLTTLTVTVIALTAMQSPYASSAQSVGDRSINRYIPYRFTAESRSQFIPFRFTKGYTSYLPTRFTESFHKNRHIPYRITRSKRTYIPQRFDTYSYYIPYRIAQRDSTRHIPLRFNKDRIAASRYIPLKFRKAPSEAFHIKMMKQMRAKKKTQEALHY